LSTNTYTFQHCADRALLVKELGREINRYAKTYGMTVNRVGDHKFKLHRTGADLQFNVTDGKVQVTVDLAWIASGYHDRIAAGLRRGLPRLLRRSEASRARRGRK
jgi:hypothetical protein